MKRMIWVLYEWYGGNLQSLHLVRADIIGMSCIMLPTHVPIGVYRVYWEYANGPT